MQDIFEKLENPANQAASTLQIFSAVRISGTESYRLGRDALGFPCLLIQVEAETDIPAPIKLKHLHVQHSVQCLLHDEKSNRDEQITFSVLRCNSQEEVVRQHFFELAETLVRSLGDVPSAQMLASRVFNFANLFRLMSEPPRRTVQGLWTELFVIARSKDPATLVACWHEEPEDHIDFNAGATRIEVKSSGQRIRRHTFSLEQLIPPPGTSTIIASVYVEPSRGGISLLDLSRSIKAKITNQSLHDRIDQVFYASLGTELENAAKSAFDYELAESSLQFYSANDVPKITGRIAPEVTQIKFRSDLTLIKPLKESVMKKHGGIIKAAIPAESVSI